MCPLCRWRQKQYESDCSGRKNHQLFDYVELTKPRITTLVLSTTLVGFTWPPVARFNLLLLLTP